MEIKTRRLILREVNKEDVADFVLVGNSKEINYFVWYVPYPLTVKGAEKMIKRMAEQAKSRRRRHYELAITLKKEKELRGMINLYDMNYKCKKCKIGYWIGKDYRKKGYTEEACKAILKFAFKNLKMHKISGKTLVNNKASNKLLKKLGFKKIATAKEDQLVYNQFIDCYLWEKFSEK